MPPESYIPKANPAKEIAEISKDFTNPRELVREVIANSLDAGATEIWIEAFEDDSLGEQDLVFRVLDNGSGMTRSELEGFFDLGVSTKRRQTNTIGEKGHGTKIAYNSSGITVYSRSHAGLGETWRAIMNEPRRSLNVAVRANGNPPAVEFEQVSSSGDEKFDTYESGTLIEIRRYDGNNLSAFMDGPLRDYIQWFTAWGGVDVAWKGNPYPMCRLYLKGLIKQDFEEIVYGHPFPLECSDFRQLRHQDPRRPENHFVKKWVSEDIPVKDHNATIKVVFSLEGDSAKRRHNIMLKRKGPPDGFPFNFARYTVQERYGIYFCKDNIPIERKNEVFTQTSEWTKWHAFVNCQQFSLTANRSSIENTQRQLLEAIKETATEWLDQYVFNSYDYDEFKRRVKLEEGRRKAQREKDDVRRRLQRSNSKTKYEISKDGKTLRFLEPNSEQAVLWLLARVSTLWPECFPWLNVLDLDQHFGYDLLVFKRHPLTNDNEPAFVELKHELNDSDDFNHSFEYLFAIICWEAKPDPDVDLVDIQKKVRKFCITPPDPSSTPPLVTKCYLVDQSGGSNIEVISLKQYLEEKLGMRRLMQTRDSRP